MRSMVTFRRRHFDDKVSNPRGVGIYYRCDICGDMLYSYSPHAVACSCRNLVLDVDAGRISAKAPNKVSIMELVGGKELKPLYDATDENSLR